MTSAQQTDLQEVNHGVQTYRGSTVLVRDGSAAKKRLTQRQCQKKAYSRERDEDALGGVVIVPEGPRVKEGRSVLGAQNASQRAV